MRDAYTRDLCWLGAVPDAAAAVETAAWEHGLSLAVRDPRDRHQLAAALQARIVIVATRRDELDALTLASHLRSRRPPDAYAVVCYVGQDDARARLARSIDVHALRETDGNVETWSRRLADWTGVARQDALLGGAR